MLDKGKRAIFFLTQTIVCIIIVVIAGILTSKGSLHHRISSIKFNMLISYVVHRAENVAGSRQFEEVRLFVQGITIK